METIVKNDNLGYWLNSLSMEGYKYIIKANDKVLSGWGNATGKTHIQLIACKTKEERDVILDDLYNDKSFNRLNCYLIPNDNHKVIRLSYNHSYTIRNDWTRCF